MLSEELKMVVAENCFEYSPISELCFISVANLSQSCSNCQNYKRDKCQKDLYDDIKSKIITN
ncbi:MAG: hypothetical protein ACERKV_09900 [Clostridiaceae bacterium]